MTDRKHLKTRVRSRMSQTGERYATARAHVVADAAPAPVAPPGPDPIGTDAGTSALRILAADAGLTLSEPLALVVGGGIGLGVFQFHYPKDAFSSFFLAGRHRWDDQRAFLTEAFERLHVTPEVGETGSARTAERELDEAVADGRPAIVWVDAAELGTRAYPAAWSGGAYHVVVVEGIDRERGTARLSDLASRPIAVPLDVLAGARGRIGKDRRRVLSLPAAARPELTPEGLLDGLRATIQGFDRPRTRQFGLSALADWAARLRRDGGDGWGTVFPAGGRLWDALLAIDSGIRGTSDGGLFRPTFAAGLHAAADLVERPALHAAAARYEALGAGWAALADAAIPSTVPAFRRARALHDQRAATYRDQAPAAVATARELWDELAMLRAAVDDDFPLDAASVMDLRRDLADRIADLQAGEEAALEDLRVAVA